MCMCASVPTVSTMKSNLLFIVQCSATACNVQIIHFEGFALRKNTNHRHHQQRNVDMRQNPYFFKFSFSER